MPETMIWYPDLAEFGELWNKETVRCHLRSMSADPPAELVFASTGSTQNAILEFQKAGWSPVGTQLNWSRWERGRTRVTVWAKHFPYCAPVTTGRNADHWNSVNGCVGFGCGVRLRQDVSRSHKLLTVVRHIGKAYAPTTVRMNKLGFRQFARTKLATYFINGWPDAEWSLTREMQFRGLQVGRRLPVAYAYPVEQSLVGRPLAA